MAIDFKPIENQDIRDNLDAVSEESRSESILMMKTQDDRWYAMTNVRGYGFMETRWWEMTGDIPDDLDGIMERAREKTRGD